MFFEYVLGLRADAARRRLVWNITSTDEMGVSRYPFGARGRLDLKVEKRASANETPVVQLKSDVPLELEIVWAGGKETRRVLAEQRSG